MKFGGDSLDQQKDRKRLGREMKTKRFWRGFSNNRKCHPFWNVFTMAVSSANCIMLWSRPPSHERMALFAFFVWVVTANVFPLLDKLIDPIEGRKFPPLH